MTSVQDFVFRSALSAPISGPEWLAEWSCQFDGEKYPEAVYLNLLDKGSALSDDEIEILGAWKDGACRVGNGAGVQRFGTVPVYFTGTWSATAASCAYEAWRQLPQHRAKLEGYLRNKEYLRFLSEVSSFTYRKASSLGSVTAAFGLSRASYVLHVFSKGAFPIYDSNAHRGLHLLTTGRYDGVRINKTKTSNPHWYLDTFCKVIVALQSRCAAQDPSTQRYLDRALFCYGKFFGRKTRR